MCEEFSSALEQRARAENEREKARSFVDPPWSAGDLDSAETLYQQGLQFFGDEYFGDSEPKLAAAETAYKRLNTIITDAIKAREARARAFAAERNHEAALAELQQLKVWVPNGAYADLEETERAALTDRDLVADARELMASGEIDAAESVLIEAQTEAYRTEIRDIQQQISRRRVGERATSLVSEGYAQLDAGNFDAADQSFTMALSVRPGFQGALDGLAESRQRRKQSDIALIQSRFEEHLANERWADALAEAKALAAADETFDTHKTLRGRLERLTEIEAALDFHINHPERFTSKNVRSEIAELLAAPVATDRPGERIEGKRLRLKTMFEASMIEYDLTLKSDGKTQVRIVPGQDLGSFKELRIRVLGGAYRVIGRRTGYKEAVVHITVPSAGAGSIITIAANERF